MLEGVININKPAGWTSQDVCAKLRSRLHIKRIGHTGTLDPMATGVLPVCLGRATRIIEYYDTDSKTYRAAMQLGIETDTLDITGNIISENREAAARITEEQIRKAFSDYKGVITQIPPRFSALRINGKRAYELARAGTEFEMKGRDVCIYSNSIEETDPAEGKIVFTVTCSKGTYIRTICDDIGRNLGCGAVMTALERTASGCFCIEDAAELSDILEMSDEQIAKLVIPMDRTLKRLGGIILNDNRVIAFCNGNSSAPGSFRISEDGFTDEAGAVYRIYGNVDGRRAFLGTGRLENNALIPCKVILPE